MDNYSQEFKDELVKVVFGYMSKHPVVTLCAGECVYQSDSAQIDALDMASDLGEVYCKYPEYQIGRED